MSKMMKMVQSGGAGKLMQMMNNLKNWYAITRRQVYIQQDKRRN
jgi:hypothetical protein